MASHALLRINAPNPQEDTETRLSTEVVVMLEDVRNALKQGPGVAHTAALRLVSFLGPQTQPLKIFHGGLAPWQQRKVKQYLETHLEHTIRVERLAHEANLSVSHFCRAFKQTFGEAPHRYIVRLRIELAQKLMLTTDLPLCQVALACGLADQAHLSKLFRRSLGESPSIWRRLNLTDPQARASSAHHAATFTQTSIGSITENTVPRGSFGVAQRRPPCASTIERQIDNPIPNPLGLVV